MALSLDSRLAFIKLRRQGIDPSAFIEERVKQKKEHVVALVDELGSALIERQAQASQVIDELLDDVAAHEFLLAPKSESERLRKALAAFKAVLDSSKARLASDEQVLAKRIKEKQALENLLSELTRKLDLILSRHSPLENDLMEFGRRVNIYIATQK